MAAHLSFLSGEHRVQPRLVGLGLRGEPHLQPLDAAREEGERRVADLVQALDQRREGFGQTRLAVAPRAQACD